MTFYGYVASGAVGVSGVKGFLTFQTSFCYEVFCEIGFFENLSVFEGTFDFEKD